MRRAFILAALGCALWSAWLAWVVPVLERRERARIAAEQVSRDSTWALRRELYVSMREAFADSTAVIHWNFTSQRDDSITP